MGLETWTPARMVERGERVGKLRLETTGAELVCSWGDCCRDFTHWPSLEPGTRVWRRDRDGALTVKKPRDVEAIERVVEDINARLQGDQSSVEVTADVEATYREINRRALRTLRAAFELDAASRSASALTRAFAQGRVDLITRILEEGGEMPRPTERITLANVDDAFSYHQWSPEQVAAGQDIREVLVAAAKVILQRCPETPLRTRAINNLVDARMLANACITFDGQF